MKRDENRLATEGKEKGAEGRTREKQQRLSEKAQVLRAGPSYISR